MELDSTVNQMLSNDYKERFKAEFLQLLIRINKLQRMIDNYGKDFKPDCPRDLLFEQLIHMKSYMAILLKRANIEKINLGAIDGSIR